MAAGNRHGILHLLVRNLLFCRQGGWMHIEQPEPAGAIWYCELVQEFTPFLCIWYKFHSESTHKLEETACRPTDRPADACGLSCFGRKAVL